MTCLGPYKCFIAFTFSNLSGTFIQSDLQSRSKQTKERPTIYTCEQPIALLLGILVGCSSTTILWVSKLRTLSNLSQVKQ